MRLGELTSAGRRKPFALVVALSVAALGAASCSAVSARATPAATLTITPANGSRGVPPGAAIMVAAKHGKLKDVTVATAAGPVRGSLAANGHWRSAQPLAVGTNYLVTATAVGANRKKVTESSTFQTLTPNHVLQATITALGTDPNVSGEILDGRKYGVGIPITIMFSRPVSNKAAVESAIQLRTSKPVVGAWYWQDDKTVIFRPRQYWPQYTAVTVTGNFDGVEAAPGLYGDRNLNMSFSIGPSLIVVASASNHYMDVFYQDKFFGRWPISTGRPGDDTPDGTYLTTFKNNPQLMVGPGYHLEVPWSVDITYSGDFIHDAYWSVGVQGAANVSHGCINTSPAHAETYYRMEVPGDPVTVTGSPSAGTPGNGWTEWFIPWSQWLGGSATHEAVVAGPTGSSLVSPASLPATTGSAPLDQPASGNARANT
ncbi:MAG TPA: Ig-like domain-containing protein [Streptosporangiaceae bacterium]|nr:Ig-like domain-containing protein [Streptosporangiaceae bacterium]